MTHAALYEDTNGSLYIVRGRKVQAGLESTGRPGCAMEDLCAAMADEWSYVEDVDGLVATHIDRHARPIAVVNELGESSRALAGALSRVAARYLYGDR